MKGKKGMITMRKNDGSSAEIAPESEKNGQVAVACTESGTSGSDQSSIPSATEKKRPGRAEQSPRKNAAFAAARRAAERERDASVREAERSAQERIDAVIAGLGQRNAAGELITTEAEYNEYKKESRGEGSVQTAHAETKTDEALDTPKTETPSTHSAGTLDAAAQSTLEMAVKEHGKLLDERTKLALDSEVKKLSGYFPELKEIGDIVRLKRYPQIKQLVMGGYALSDAVRLTYEDVYVQRRASAAAAQARANIAGTSHLTATKARGDGSGSVSEGQIRTYLEAIPGSTREQAIRAYQKYRFREKG